MASVYAAVHAQTGARVALKVLSRYGTDNDDARDRFCREGKLANRVDHDGVISVFDDGVTDDGCPFLVMELLEGETLDQRRASAPDGRLPVSEVVKVSLAVADVLAAAHDAGLVHRDVKPPNVFLTRSGGVKLLDFGVAGKRQQTDDCTMTGAGCGTPLFMAPEQITGVERIDARADVFALGATMYRLLSGRFPFEASNIVEYLQRLIDGKPPIRIDTIVPGLDRGLADVVTRALSLAPEHRFADAREMACAIARAVWPQVGPPTSVTLAIATRPVRGQVEDVDRTTLLPPHASDGPPVSVRPVAYVNAPPAMPSMPFAPLIARGDGVQTPAFPPASPLVPRSALPTVQVHHRQVRHAARPTAALILGVVLAVLLCSVAALAAWPGESAAAPAAVSVSAIR